MMAGHLTTRWALWRPVPHANDWITMNTTHHVPVISWCSCYIQIRIISPIWRSVCLHSVSSTSPTCLLSALHISPFIDNTEPTQYNNYEACLKVNSKIFSCFDKKTKFIYLNGHFTPVICCAVTTSEIFVDPSPTDRRITVLSVFLCVLSLVLAFSLDSSRSLTGFKLHINIAENPINKTPRRLWRICVSASLEIYKH